jgi:hypothetical protein
MSDYDRCIICKGEKKYSGYFFNLCCDCIKYFDDGRKDDVQGLKYLASISNDDMIEIKKIINENNETDTQRKIRLSIIERFNDFCDTRNTK